MRHHSKTRRLTLESLENRSLLAGNVLASVDASGLLTVTGDDEGNRINIRQLPASGSTTPWPGARYSIERGWTPRGQLPTTINGQSAVIVEGVKSVNIALHDGNDLMRVSSPNRPGSITSLPGAVNIDLGRGRDGAHLNIENHQQVNVH